MPNTNHPLSHTLNEMVSAQPGTPLSDAERTRILRLACQKAGIPHAAPARDAAKRHVGKPVRILAIVAAAICALSATVFAAAPLLAKMLAGKISFFDNAPAQSTVSDPADAPRGNFDAAAATLEAYNAPVGQNQTIGDVSMTLDTVSMDCAGVSAFFTISGGRAMAAAVDAGDYMPAFSQLWNTAPFFQVSVNGTQLNPAMAMDFYRADASTIKLWVYTRMQEVPQGDAVTLTLRADEVLNMAGDWAYSVSLDGPSVRQGSKTVAPQAYSLGPDVVVDLTKEFPGGAVPEGWPASYTKASSLDLRYMAFGPVGGVIGVMPHVEQVPKGEYPTAMSAQEIYLTDDTGKELHSVSLPSGGASSSVAVNYLGLSAPDPAAAALTITPVRLPVGEEWSNLGERRTITTEELRNGASFATSELGGYTVQNFQEKDGAFTYDLVPYGWTLNIDLVPDDSDLISYVEERATELNSGEETTLQKSALLTDTTDLQTGVISVRHDYYAATDEELAKVASWHYYYQGGYRLDREHAVTVPLTPVP